MYWVLHPSLHWDLGWVWDWSQPPDVGTGTGLLLLDFSLIPLIKKKKNWQPHPPVSITKNNFGWPNSPMASSYSHCHFILFKAANPVYSMCVLFLGGWASCLCCFRMCIPARTLLCGWGFLTTGTDSILDILKNSIFVPSSLENWKYETNYQVAWRFMVWFITMSMNQAVCELSCLIN